MFYTTSHAMAGLAAIAQIMDETGITHRVAAEIGRRHAGAVKELFDSAQDGHGVAAPFRDSGLGLGRDLK